MCSYICVLIIFLIISSVVIYVMTTDGKQFPTGLCTLLGHSENSPVSGAITVISLLSQWASCISIPILYLNIIHLVSLSRENLDKSQMTNQQKGVTSSALMALATSWLRWMPSSFVLFLTLVWNKYPYSMLVWTVLVIMPLKAIMDPFLFTFSVLIKDCIKQHIKHRSQVLGFPCTISY